MKHLVAFIFLVTLLIITGLRVSAHILPPESTWRTHPPAVERDVCFESDLGVRYPSMSLTTADWIRLRMPRQLWKRLFANYDGYNSGLKEKINGEDCLDKGKSEND